MERYEGTYGKPHPEAAPRLSQFAFLVGSWRCRARLKQDDGTWEELDGSWVGCYVLDGYAIWDEFRMTKPSGELLVLGVNVRVFDTSSGSWNLKWLDALGGTWVDLGPEELGGVNVDDHGISYIFKEPVATHPLTRATFQDITPDHFTWRGERSEDGTDWEEFLVIDANRSD